MNPEWDNINANSNSNLFFENRRSNQFCLQEWLEWIPHTADTGFIVKAESVSELFERAGWAFFAIMTDPRLVRPIQSDEIIIEAEDLELLLVRWLTELLYLFEVKKNIYAYFKVEELKIDLPKLHAIVKGEKVDLDRHQIYCEVKAVTFHGLRITKEGDLWKATVIVDI